MIENQCLLPEAFWNCSLFPVDMKINFIRVYQDPTDSSHTIGCSTDKYPTAGFINGNPETFADWTPTTVPLWCTQLVVPVSFLSLFE